MEERLDKNIWSEPKEFNVTILNVELTNRCQLKCKWCGDKKTRPVGDMPITLLETIVKSFTKPIEVRPFIAGEPFLYPKIIEAIDIIMRCGHKVNIHTNAITLDEKKTTELIEVALKHPQTLLKISFSFHGRTLSENKKLQGNLQDIVIKNVKHFVEKNETFGSPIRVGIMNIVPYTTRLKLSDYVPFFRSVNYLTRWPHDWDRYRSIESANPDEVYKPPCLFLKNTFNVYWNGDVTVCCADLNGERVIGNIVYDGADYLLRVRDSACQMQTEGLVCPICEGCGRYKPKVKNESDNKSTH